MGARPEPINVSDESTFCLQWQTDRIVQCIESPLACALCTILCMEMSPKGSTRPVDEAQLLILLTNLCPEGRAADRTNEKRA
jgi:hypothetical protein